MWQPAERVGAYRITAQLRTGGMGTVLLAVREGVAGFQRPVALKVIHPHLAQDPDFVHMFIDEALLASRIDHPNVVKVEELGRENGCHFLAMEYVHGPSLAQLLRRLAERGRTLKVEIAVAIAMDIAAGLHAAHETRGDDGQLLGVVHRDVKPQNVLIGQSGQVKLIDFGIAKARSNQIRSSTGSIKGTLRYLAPEQARSDEVDRRTDVYALGVTLWEMLAGRRLFQTDSDLELLDMVRNPCVPLVRAIREDVPESLAAVLDRMLAPDPADRPATAAEVRRALIESTPTAPSLGLEMLSDLVNALFAAHLAHPALESGRPEAAHAGTATTAPTAAAKDSVSLELLTVAGITVDPKIGEDVPEPTVVQASGARATRDDPRARQRGPLLAIAISSGVLAAAAVFTVFFGGGVFPGDPVVVESDGPAPDPSFATPVEEPAAPQTSESAPRVDDDVNLSSGTQEAVPPAAALTPTPPTASEPEPAPDRSAARRRARARRRLEARARRQRAEETRPSRGSDLILEANAPY